MSQKRKSLQEAKSARAFGFNTNNIGTSTNLSVKKNDPVAVAKNLSNYISPVQLMRLRTDVSMWRDSIAEAEKAYYPFRVKMQRVYIDTVLNGHVFALIERRKDLTLLRKFKVCDAKGVENEELTQYFIDATWFGDFLNYTLDAMLFGYSLISLGDIVDDKMQDVTLVPRWFISPDRMEVGSFIYATSGMDFREEPQSDWHIYVKTKSDNGTTPCGYGLLYQIALYEIFLRNVLGFNGDFVELYAMPYRVGKTTKTTESERAELETAIRNMGSAGYAIIDPMDEITFLETALGGTGFLSYENLEKRCEDKISKLILGHSDVMDSTPGKLGSGQGGKTGNNQSPTAAALADKQTKDGRFIEPIINHELIPRLKSLGILNIADGYHFEFLNDSEEQEFRTKEDASNLITAQIAQTMKAAGLQMDEKYFSDRTGIMATKAELPPVKPMGNDLRDNVKVKNRLKELYK